MVVGMIRQFFDWQWADAETAFRQAIALSPGGHAEAHHELSMLLMRRRRFDEALREGLRAWNLAPTSARFEQGLGEVYVYNEQYKEAMDIAGKLLASDSTFGGGYRLLGLAYMQQRNFKEAAKAWQDCQRLAPGCDARAYLAYINAVTGRRADALKLVDTLEAEWRQQSTPAKAANIADELAGVYAGLAEKVKALDWLERGADTHTFMLYVGIEPAFRSLRGEPRFKAVLKKIGLPE
jgi:Flp pilus assembly protein TadD